MANPNLWGWGTDPLLIHVWGWEDVVSIAGIYQLTAYSLTGPPIRAALTGDTDNGYNASSYSGTIYA